VCRRVPKQNLASVQACFRVFVAGSTGAYGTRVPISVQCPIARGALAPDCFRRVRWYYGSSPYKRPWNIEGPRLQTTLAPELGCMLCCGEGCLLQGALLRYLWLEPPHGYLHRCISTWCKTSCAVNGAIPPEQIQAQTMRQASRSC
jgi:hypothetical protein